MAERGGFEPPVELPLLRFSRPMIQSRKIKELKILLGINVLKSYTKNQ
ncbi:TPA: hypothetical protein HH134_005278 [Escherichia coli]|uniref:Uncharacterized protein n=1 Tax=Escherichia coli O25b:H4 TaxID=941280 RepID=A0A192C8K5_ECO25|nr:hypothetical protein WLH_00755 [Escherichia coli O25b:H4]EFH2495200.1 hypothetical protein [Escherichia coli]ESE06746.1 hypothetical protein HMPREF1615_02515 [Escherichia coli 908632]EFI9031488.1 hypothetical protein [Escherichia coli]HAH4697734.1 hypothetical protein [Escherichia coli]